MLWHAVQPTRSMIAWPSLGLALCNRYATCSGGFMLARLGAAAAAAVFLGAGGSGSGLGDRLRRYMMMSARSLSLGTPAKVILVPGA